MTYNYITIKQEVETYLLQHPNDYYYATDLAKALAYSNYVINKVLKAIECDRIMTYTSEQLIYVTKDGKEKQIPESYVDKFIVNGWTRGRCEDSKRAVCLAEGGDPDKPKMCWVHNSDQEIEIPLADKARYLESGYTPGKRRIATTKGKIAVHKDDIDKYINPEDLSTYVDKGWLLGGKEKRNLRDYSNVWNKGKTKETDARLQLISEKVSENNISMPQEERDKISRAITKLWENEEYRFNQVSKRQGRSAWNKGLTGVYHWTDAQRLKHDETKRRNKTFNTSQPEEDYYNYLVDKYGADDVVRQYKEERYPFRCDFYVISEDLFIELNTHWTHGEEPYDETNPKHQKIRAELQEKAKTSKFYEVALKVWTEVDVLKQRIARENNLNYEVIYGKYDYKRCS